MATTPTYRWHLRKVMAENDVYKTSALVPLLAGAGVVLSREQVYRLVTKAPERLSLKTLAALCDIFSCSPNDLIEVSHEPETPRARPVSARSPSTPPRRARVARRP